MRILLTLDRKDYSLDMPVREKYSTRAVIVQDGRIATQHGAAGDYRLLGGGVEPGRITERACAGRCRRVRPDCQAGQHQGDWGDHRAEAGYF